MKNLKNILIVSILLILPLSGLANQSDYDVNYDSIISELSRSRGKVALDSEEDPFNNIKLHGGVGFVTSLINITPGGKNITGLHNGVEANFGIDLFSKQWMAEGSIRSFGDSVIEGNNISLKEFDLKLTYHNRFGRAVNYRMGMGLAARYLNHKPASEVNVLAQQNVVTQYTTPASIFYFGVSAVLSKTITLGIEASYRDPMTSETIDNGALDTGVKLDFHF